MAGLVAQYQQGAFSSPTNGTIADATVVLSNDNNVRSKHNSHDSDSTIHVQSSPLASRPAAGTAQRFWVTTDGLRAYVDSGAVWNEVDYLCKTAGGTVAGATTFSAGVTFSAAITYGGVTLSNSVTGTGSMVLSASPTFTGTAAFAAVTATGVTLGNGQYYKATRTSGSLVINLLGIESGTDRTLLTATGDFVVQNGSGTASLTVTTGGVGTFAGGLTVSAGSVTITNGNVAFGANDSYIGFASNHVKFNNTTDTVTIATASATARVTVTAATTTIASTTTAVQALTAAGKITANDTGNATVAGIQLGGSGNGLSLPSANVVNVIQNGATALTFTGSQAATFSSSVQSNSLIFVHRDGSNTYGSGALFQLENAAGNRAWAYQLDASNNVMWGYYGGTSFSTMMSLSNAGALVVAAGISATTGTFSGAVSGTTITASSTLSTGSGAAIGWGGASLMFNSSDGVIRLSNNAGTDFTRLQFGGTTSSFPAIKRNSTGLDFRLADDSAYATVQMGLIVGYSGATQVFGTDSGGIGANGVGISVYDKDNGGLKRVSVGAADSGGAGFRILRVAN